MIFLKEGWRLRKAQKCWGWGGSSWSLGQAPSQNGLWLPPAKPWMGAGSPSGTSSRADPASSVFPIYFQSKPLKLQLSKRCPLAHLRRHQSEGFRARWSRLGVPLQPSGGRCSGGIAAGAGGWPESPWPRGVGLGRCAAEAFL